MKIKNLSVLMLLVLPACASIFDGTSQQIMVNTNPPGADCILSRKGATIGRISPTPAATTVEKTKNDITITCAKPGYEQATYLNHSGVAGATYADIIGGLLGAVGWGIDSASGADNKYDSPVNLSLVPQSAASPQPGSLSQPTPGLK